MQKIISNLNEQTIQPLKREDILKYFGNLEQPTFKSDLAILRALLRIYLYQTYDERQSEETVEHNKIGFSGVDGKILTSMCKQLVQRGFLSEKQMQIIRKKVVKYARQIARHINTGDINKHDDKNIFINKIISKWMTNSRNRYNADGKLKIYSKSNLVNNIKLLEDLVLMQEIFLLMILHI